MVEKYEVLKALGHTTRYQIAELLLRKPMCVGDLEIATESMQANVSQHLSVLRYAGVVTYERNGAIKIYSVPPAMQAAVRTILGAL